MDLHTDGKLIHRLSLATTLLFVLALGSTMSSGVSGSAILLLFTALVLAFGMVGGVLAFLYRYPYENSKSETAITYIVGLLIFIAIGFSYYLVCKNVLGINVSVKDFGALGDSLGPLGSLLAGAALIFSIQTNRSQLEVQRNQQQEITEQTNAWKRQAECQSKQADELSRNNDLYKQLIMAQKMATAASISVQLSNYYIDNEKHLQESPPHATDGLPGVPHNLPYQGRAAFERDRLTKLLVSEINMIRRLADEIMISEVQRRDIAEWEKVILPKNTGLVHSKDIRR